MIPIPTLILGLIGLFVVWLILDSIVMDTRNFFQKPKNKIKTLFIIGVLLAAAGYLKKEGKIAYNFDGDLALNAATVAIGLAVMWTLYRWINRKTTKKRALEIEDARRTYIKRVRKGLTLEDAENKAFEFIKKRVKDKGLKPYKSVKDFKNWQIYFEGKNNKYKVLVDSDGEITDWTTITGADDPWV